MYWNDTHHGKGMAIYSNNGRQILNNRVLFFFFFTRTHGTRAFSALKRIETVPEEYYSHDKKGKLVAL